MNIVAIETATSACAVGVRASDGFELARVVDEQRRHSEVLTAAISAMLGEAGLAPRDVNRVVVDRGPGLFTGLRVGVATALAFAQALGCELVAVTSLEMLAHGAHARGVRGSFVSCVDGRRGEVFVQEFELGEGVFERGVPEVAVAAHVAARWARHDGAVTFAGDGAERYADDFDALTNAQRWSQRVPPVSAALALGATRVPVASVTPLYLRDADAVANFSTRQHRA
ncbi:MAG TPA: tRNA (adenosine(37)-N6)-threonylcarbamoyltransferase complex dimerization subunit type 1 TsaB [Acidimicrobiales bacterium]|nr:tRNA (adenosine(37)-N6)-threonylcarbamoyltransferase complex dimerization subunit type 1 TsaB [Acidimicrobiales bacterium]